MLNKIINKSNIKYGNILGLIMKKLFMKRLYTIIMALATLVVSANAQSLSVANIEAQTGEETALVVSLTEGTSMTALQFNLSLPEGMSPKTESGNRGATLGSATDGHSLNVEKLASGDLLFVLYSMEQKAFKNGELLRIPLMAGAAASEANGKLYTIRTATASAVSHPRADVSFSAKVTEPVQPVDYKAGDANGDGSVNVFDVTAIVNYILGSPSENFVFKAADVNNDENVNVFDVTRVVNIILGVDVAAAKMRHAAALEGTGTMLAVADGKETNLVVDNATRYIAMQFDVTVPAGQSLDVVDLNNSADHVLSYQQISANRYRVIAYSPQNACFEPTEGTLVSLKQADACIEDALFVTADGRCINMKVADEVTGIAEVEGGMDEYAIYNMAGQYVGNDKQALPKGIYISNGKKYVVQ